MVSARTQVPTLGVQSDVVNAQMNANGHSRPPVSYADRTGGFIRGLGMAQSCASCGNART